MNKLTKTTALLLVVMLLLSSCGGGSSSKPATASASGTAATSKSGRDTINLTLNQVVETLNPYDSSSIINNQLYCQIYETLFFFNDSGELEPRLAEKYEVGSDNMTYTVHLRKGVKFHNGKEMKAADVAWSLDYELKSGPYTKMRTNLTDFESATVVDDYTVQIKSKAPSAAFFSNICINGYIMCKDEYLAAVTNKKIGVEWVPCGTGPYTITTYNPDAEIKLQAFADYYRGKARIDKINYKILTDNNTITVAFESGELDFIVVPTASWANIKANSNYTTYLSPTNHTSFFHINVNNNDALSNKLVRQALSYAIDRESMCVAAYDGIAQPAYSMFNAASVFGGFTVKELEAAGIPTYQYNPQKAKQLLTEAGYPNGVDIGTILTISGSYWEKMATVFQSNLADIGVKVKIELADSAACRARRKEHNYQLATTGTNYTPEASYSYQYFRYLTPEQRTAGMYSELDVKDKDLDALFLKAMSETDRDKRKADYLEVNRMLQDKMYSIPTFHKSIPYAYNKSLVCDKINTNYYYVYNFSWK